MDLLEKAQTVYYRQMDNKTADEKFDEMLESFDEIGEMTDEQLKGELYSTTSTFGLGTPTGHTIISDMIENTGKNLKAAIENRNYDVAKAIAEYVSGYSLFFYGMQKPTKRFFEFLMKILALNATNFNYESRAHFAYSFLKEIQKLPYPKN